MKHPWFMFVDDSFPEVWVDLTTVTWFDYSVTDSIKAKDAGMGVHLNVRADGSLLSLDVTQQNYDDFKQALIRW